MEMYPAQVQLVQSVDVPLHLEHVTVVYILTPGLQGCCTLTTHARLTVLHNHSSNIISYAHKYF